MLLQPLVTGQILSNRPIRFCMHLLFHKIINLTLRTALILTRNRQYMVSKCKRPDEVELTIPGKWQMVQQSTPDLAGDYGIEKETIISEIKEATSKKIR